MARGTGTPPPRRPYCSPLGRQSGRWLGLVVRQSWIPDSTMPEPLLGRAARWTGPDLTCRARRRVGVSAIAPYTARSRGPRSRSTAVSVGRLQPASSRLAGHSPPASPAPLWGGCRYDPAPEPTSSSASVVRTSSVRDEIPSFVNTFRRWYSTVRGLRKSSAAASRLLAPLATSRAI